MSSEGSERASERANKWRNEWPSTLRVDLIQFQLTVRCGNDEWEVCEVWDFVGRTDEVMTWFEAVEQCQMISLREAVVRLVLLLVFLSILTAIGRL